MSGEKHASRFFVSGIVQGVGFRYFVQDAAERLRLTGYVRNVRDGRVEVYVIGAPAQFTRLRTTLEEGPRGAMVTGIVEEQAPVDPQFENEFTITYDR